MHNGRLGVSRDLRDRAFHLTPTTDEERWPLLRERSDNDDFRALVDDVLAALGSACHGARPHPPTW